jgi:hypothetical protein
MTTPPASSPVTITGGSNFWLAELRLRHLLEVVCEAKISFSSLTVVWTSAFLSL